MLGSTASKADPRKIGLTAALAQGGGSRFGRGHRWAPHRQRVGLPWRRRRARCAIFTRAAVSCSCPPTGRPSPLRCPDRVWVRFRQRSGPGGSRCTRASRSSTIDVGVSRGGPFSHRQVASVSGCPNCHGWIEGAAKAAPVAATIPAAQAEAPQRATAGRTDSMRPLGFMTAGGAEGASATRTGPLRGEARAGTSRRS